MADDASKRTDLRLVTITSVVILGLGLLVAGGLWLSLRATTGTEACSGKVVVGWRPDYVKRAKLGPFYEPRDGICDYWVAFHGGKLLAIKSTLPGRTCTVVWKGPKNTFTCGPDRVTWSELTTWPSTEVTSGPKTHGWQIDFGTAPVGTGH
jgi:hypothetical protein